MTTKDILTKDHLTRDEARKAIAMLILRRDNLDIIMMSAFAILIGFASSDVTIGLSLGVNNLFFACLGITVDLIILIIALYVLFEIRNIEQKANKLAEYYKLEEFLHAIQYKKNKCVNE